jgi:hypothetical protein
VKVLEVLEVGEVTPDATSTTSTNLQNLHNLPFSVDSQLHIMWTVAAMVDAGGAYRPHTMHTEVS